MTEKSPADNFPAGYEPPKVWTWEKGNGGAFAHPCKFVRFIAVYILTKHGAQ